MALNRKSAFGYPLTNIPYGWPGQVNPPKKKQPSNPYLGPAPGTYDPALDAALGAVQRGLADTKSDTGTQGLRNLADYGIGVAQTNEGRQNQLQDLGFGREDYQTGYGRNMQDLAAARQRANEDYTSQIEALQRAYQRLGNQQTQRARGMGIVSGGTYVAAQNRRTANEAIDRQPIDLSHARTLQDIATQEQRLQQDLSTYGGRYDVNVGRVNTAADEGIGQLGLGLTRSENDLRKGLSRATREAAQFGIGTEAQKAQQSNYLGDTQVQPGISTADLLRFLGVA